LPILFNQQSLGGIAKCRLLLKLDKMLKQMYIKTTI